MGTDDGGAAGVCRAAALATDAGTAGLACAVLACAVLACAVLACAVLACAVLACAGVGAADAARLNVTARVRTPPADDQTHRTRLPRTHADIV
jgi:hypothetical protein